ncbi:MAG: TonB-dependent receptor [Gammaproteobacteria bacterium]|nr:TonB-dependent receptor [Gammaproteobacteria bacterium]
MKQFFFGPALSLVCLFNILVDASAADLTSDAGEITVTGTREKTIKAETAESSDVIEKNEVRDTRPAHPSEITSQVPGAHISVTGGEGHQTAIRQPISTSPLYLYLEDGIPSRSTGFFNHNALYELNLPQAESIEITKGPGTALYGSDAIGGIINVMTRPAPLKPEAEVNLETGEYGWRRMLISGGNTREDDGVRAEANLTHTDGWREATDYDRQAGTVRWDSTLTNGATIKTLLSGSSIDQQTAGSSRLLKDDYENNPTLNYTPISYRQVDALRLSVAYEKEGADSLVSIVPYVRSNAMEYMPNWSFSYDPKISNTENASCGLLLKYRKDFDPLRTRIVLGLDADYSPGQKLEKSIDAVLVGRTYTSYTETQTIYDYDVTFTGTSPYLHVETSPVEKLRIAAGVRYDRMEYDYDNHLADTPIVVNPASTAFPVTYNHPVDSRVDYSHLSPKLGAAYVFSEALNGFVSYRHAFRVPSEGQLFSPGKATSSLELEPVKVDSYELGVRGKSGEQVSYEVSVYHMVKEDDILTYKYPDNSREVMNAGETLHRGVEAGVHFGIGKEVSLSIAASYAKHTYELWQPDSTTDLSGKEMESAPRLLANTRLHYRPALLKGGRLTLEWERLGSYWMDQENTYEYDGHDLYHLRINYPVNKAWEFYGRIMNIVDERYATAASYNTTGDLFEYAPGMPRTFYAGVNYNFR